MLTLEAGRTRARQAGLTLVELLVVLLIIGMTAGLAALAVPRGESDLSKAARFVERDITALRDRAVTEVALFGLNADGQVLTRFRGAAGAWQVAAQVGLPGDVDIDLAPVEGWALPEHETELVLGISPDDPEAEEEPFRPLVVFGPEGSVTPFVVTLRDRRAAVIIRVGPFGRVEVDDDA
ncbi:MAG: prepilin-type N-terminal cleavage/methylation domain-containing protein [Pseudomonadota bacterium]